MNESNTFIFKIIPKLEKLGWDKERMKTQYRCKAGVIDLLYFDDRSRPLVVLEAKRPGKVKEGTMDKQAVPYAKAVKAPIAVVWDGSNHLETRHIKMDEPLKDYEDNPITKHVLLTENHLKFFRSRQKNSLSAKIKTTDEMRKAFAKMNDFGRYMGLTSGMERVVEIAKILFVKMLCDNSVYIDSDDWDRLKADGEKHIIRSINRLLLQNIRDEGIEIPKLQIKKEKSSAVWKVVELLDEVNLNHHYYDVTGSLFEAFLSERARGGGTNDLGQYFTPKKINNLLYVLSKYEDGDKIYDPYCGTGGILLSFFQHNTKSMETGRAKRKFGKQYLFGNEISPTVAMLAKMNMVIAGDGHSNIHDIDSLSSSNPFIRDNKRYDIVATNMPFAPSVPNDTELEYFDIAANSNAVGKFIEHCLRRCKSGGRVALITPKGFLTEKATADFRRKLLERYCVEGVYMLYDGVFHPYTGVFSCLLIIKKEEPEEYIDFFSVKGDDDIEIVKEWHGKEGRYNHGFYRVRVSDIVANKDCDWRGRIYKNSDAKFTIRDLVSYVTKVKTSNTHKKFKMTTPNAVQDGVKMIESMSSKLADTDNEGSFNYQIEQGAIIISRISNKRKLDGRYLGSAMAGEHAGHLITSEYHQIIPKNPNDLYYILHWLRSHEFQKVVELAKGTGGQQRIEIDLILNESIPEPTDELRKLAESNLMEIEKSLIEIERYKENIVNIKAQIAENEGGGGRFYTNMKDLKRQHKKKRYLIGKNGTKSEDSKRFGNFIREQNSFRVKFPSLHH